MDFEYIQSYYKVPAEFGRQILFNGNRKGVIIKDLGNYIGVNFDDDKPGRYVAVHPKDGVEYLDIVKPRKMSKGQRRYWLYKEHDTMMPFIEWLKHRCYENN